MTSRMGELDSDGDVLTVEERLDTVSARKASHPADPTSISEECLSAAEEAAEEVLNCVHPTLDAEEKRRDVIDCVQQLVKIHLNCQVVPYGSVPLKTYLPDGDIDLTILKGPDAEETLPHDVLSLLQAEEQNENADYLVKDTQFIDAEVKLVKCLVQNIVVDVTFNQLGGLSTLCFLEQVDRFIGRNHVFKHSIILVKTWCYYESRILGAHHGLLSTYALETLVLYIFHFFHSSLKGPLSVLYRFLDYYSRFDWENYCISLKGPAHKSSLPDIVVNMPENRCSCLLLSEEFLEKSMELFSVPSKLDANPKAFQPKHLNIIDPLKENNNLGRSVHRGNFYRIRSAFKYGAHKLGQILLRPRDEIADEIFKFFSNACSRHGHQITSSTGHLGLEYSDDESLTASLSSPVKLLSDDDMSVKSFVSDSDLDYDSVSVEQTSILDRHLMKEVASEASDPSDETLVSRSSAESGSSEDHLNNGVWTSSEKLDFNPSLKIREEHTSRWCMDNRHAACSCITGSNSTSDASILENPSLDFRDIDSASEGGEFAAFNPLADLTGDYDSNIRSLLCAQLCHRSASSPPNIRKIHQSILHGEEVLYASIDSVFLGTALLCGGVQKTRGLGTYFPDMTAFHMERPWHWRDRNHHHNHNHHKYGQSHGWYTAGEPNSCVHGKVIHEGRRLQKSCQSPDTDRGCRIEFGSVGSLAEEVISSSAHARCSTMKAQRERVIHLKNEDEFPPLCL